MIISYDPTTFLRSFGLFLVIPLFLLPASLDPQRPTREGSEPKDHLISVRDQPKRRTSFPRSFLRSSMPAPSAEFVKRFDFALTSTQSLLDPTFQYVEWSRQDIQEASERRGQDEDTPLPARHWSADERKRLYRAVSTRDSRGNRF